jgi:hypothetical protein
METAMKHEELDNEIELDNQIEVEELSDEEQERRDVAAELAAADEADEREAAAFTGKKQEIGRAYLLIHRTALLCRECNTVRRVTDFQPYARRAVLSCGHKRGINPS